MFYFSDANMPGIVYYGDQRAFDWWMFSGCYPQLWSDKQKTAPVGQTVPVRCRIEGQSVVEYWDVRLAEAPAPGVDSVFDEWLADTLCRG